LPIRHEPIRTADQSRNYPLAEPERGGDLRANEVVGIVDAAV
jgi:hypothetical protein